MSVANHVAHHAELGEPSQEFLQKVQRTKSRRSVTKSLYVQKQTKMRKNFLLPFTFCWAVFLQKPCPNLFANTFS